MTTKTLARRVHPIAAGLATLCILTFLTATLATEATGDAAAITAGKTGILWGLIVLIPALAATGATGFLLGRGRHDGLVRAKRRRMPLIALNGLVILVPAAVFLADRARAGALDGVFYGIQAVEIVAGLANLALLGLSFRDGRRLRAGRRRTMAPRSTRECRPTGPAGPR